MRSQWTRRRSRSSRVLSITVRHAPWIRKFLTRHVLPGRGLAVFNCEMQGLQSEPARTGQPHVRAVPSPVVFSHDHHNVLIL